MENKDCAKNYCTRDECSYIFSAACNRHCRKHVAYRPPTEAEQVATDAWAALQADLDRANPYSGALRQVVRREKLESVWEGYTAPTTTSPTKQYPTDEYGNVLDGSELEGLPEEPATAPEVQIINCTPHTLNIGVEGQPEVVLPASGVVPRVQTSQEVVDHITGIPVVSTRYGAVEGLPDPVAGIVYVVSALVLAALAGARPDCVAPDTSPTSAIRNDAGQIIGVRRLTR